jgi:hypothetical protein
LKSLLQHTPKPLFPPCLKFREIIRQPSHFLKLG